MVLHEEAVHRLLISVAREAEVADLSLFLHSEQELRESCAVIEILVDVELADVVVKIKIEVVCLALLELLVEYFLMLSEV